MEYSSIYCDSNIITNKITPNPMEYISSYCDSNIVTNKTIPNLMEYASYSDSNIITNQTIPNLLEYPSYSDSNIITNQTVPNLMEYASYSDSNIVTNKTIPNLLQYPSPGSSSYIGCIIVVFYNLFHAININKNIRYTVSRGVGADGKKIEYLFKSNDVCGGIKLLHLKNQEIQRFHGFDGHGVLYINLIDANKEIDGYQKHINHQKDELIELQSFRGEVIKYL